MTNVLLTNDDGPPNPHESPYILGLYRHLTTILGWNVKVVIPNAQKSWIGKAHQLKHTTRGWYFYPRDDGQGEILDHPRSLKDGEVAEWILLDGTPASCANIALHNLYPGQIDLVISGPNLGRNTSAAFALSSGTLGAALSSSLSKIRSIALSYGTVAHPTPKEYFEPAHALSCSIIRHLWNEWGKDEEGLRNGETDLYSINIPMVEELLSGSGMPVYGTFIWRNSYGRLYENITHSKTPGALQSVRAGGPDVFEGDKPVQGPDAGEPGNLLFKFSPDVSGIIQPIPSSLPIGSDAWAIQNKYVSVTPLRASFAEARLEGGRRNDRILIKL